MKKEGSLLLFDTEPHNDANFATGPSQQRLLQRKLPNLSRLLRIPDDDLKEQTTPLPTRKRNSCSSEVVDEKRHKGTNAKNLASSKSFPSTICFLSWARRTWNASSWRFAALIPNGPGWWPTINESCLKAFDWISILYSKACYYPAITTGWSVRPFEN